VCRAFARHDMASVRGMYCSCHQVDDSKRFRQANPKMGENPGWCRVSWFGTCQGYGWSRYIGFFNQRTSSAVNQTDIYGHSLFYGTVCVVYFVLLLSHGFSFVKSMISLVCALLASNLSTNRISSGKRSNGCMLLDPTSAQVE